jgi:hypothetical protein
MRNATLILIAALVAASASNANDVRPLVVHEWGTITTQHRADGTPNGHLNRIAAGEELPAFVHRYEPEPTRNDPAATLQKGVATPGRPDVTMRLETPVIYFYPPTDWAANTQFDVDVNFRGGVLNEFYPIAQAAVALDVMRIVAKQNAGIPLGWNGKTLDNYVVGSLRWQHVVLTKSAQPPSTQQHTWLAPRNVKAALVSTQAESERYLFYRGVAHLDALAQTRVTPEHVQLFTPAKLLWMSQASMTIPKAWLIDSQADGRMAMRTLAKLVIDKKHESHELVRIPRFVASDYSDNVAALRAAMKQQLIAEGLFDDEAEAMLETWRDSYFKQPGLRLLYIVPNEWLQYFLPLHISAPHQLTRVLVGRIDLL